MLTDLTISQFVGLLFGVLLVWKFIDGGIGWIITGMDGIIGQFFPTETSPDETETTS